MKILIVIDMQNDFITGALGTAEAVRIVDNVAAEIAAFKKAGDPVLFTRDTHQANYLETQEGKNLPVPHCIQGTKGWQITEKLDTTGCEIIDKPSFGSTKLAAAVSATVRKYEAEHKQSDTKMSAPDEIVLIGLCTDICVISNAMILKASFPETEISVISRACAGVTPQSHETALQAMQTCQIKIIR